MYYELFNPKQHKIVKVSLRHYFHKKANKSENKAMKCKKT
jgi:hypothetical protein